MKYLISKSAIGFLVATSVLLSVLVIEIALRWFAPVSLKAISLRVEQDLPGLSRSIRYERDDLGLLRIGMWPLRKSPDDIRILCIGASTTDQPTQDTEHTWCAQLQMLLHGRFSEKRIVVQTATFAQGGWRIADLVARVPDILDVLNPDVVITLMGVNDLAFNGGAGYEYKGISDRITSIRNREVTASYEFWRRCEASSQLCRRIILLRQKIHSWRHGHPSRSLEWHTRNLPNLRREYQEYEYIEAPKRKPDALREFSEGMGAMLQLLDQRGITAVVLGQPVLWNTRMSEAERLALWFYVETPVGRVRPSGAWLHTEMSRFNNAQKVIAEEHGARYVDLDEHLPKDLSHYFDDCHFTDLGSQRVAETILPMMMTAMEERFNNRWSP